MHSKTYLDTYQKSSTHHLKLSVYIKKEKRRPRVFWASPMTHCKDPAKIFPSLPEMEDIGESAGLNDDHCNPIQTRTHPPSKKKKSCCKAKAKAMSICVSYLKIFFSFSY